MTMTRTGAVWGLHHGDRQVARLTVTGADFPWVQADVECLPAFEEVRSLFVEQEQAFDSEDYDRADVLYDRIRGVLTMTFPGGGPVAEFLLRVYDDGTAGWRWHDEPFEAVGD
ncbi:hypothetical protein [Longispora fulva]|uniref:Uncharacterized protein n=1 Tax=Longispora fulva TaxID=619741 RepID=A0A8J7G6M3_9ACTN|nr:hypothetical protein [Longispora fulva]MBG6134658.1 hypothetical protein [Longispora fulva]